MSFRVDVSGPGLRISKEAEEASPGRPCPGKPGRRRGAARRFCLIDWTGVRRATSKEIGELSHLLSFAEAQRRLIGMASPAVIWIGACRACGQPMLVEVEPGDGA